MENLILPVVLLVAAYVIADELQQHSELDGWKKRLTPQGRPSWWNDKARPWLNVSTGWKNKHNWQPSWLFNTALVSLTDGEHFFQMLKHVALAGLVWLLTGVFYMAVIAYAVIAVFSYLLNEVFLKK